MQERMQERLQKLEEYKVSLGVGTPVVDTSIVNKYAEMTLEEANELTLNQCNDAVLMLRQCSYFIQSQLNNEQIRKNHLKIELECSLASVWSQYDNFMPKEIKTRLIGKENSAVQEILQYLDYTDQRILSLKDVSNHLIRLSDAVNNMKYAKSKREVEY